MDNRIYQHLNEEVESDDVFCIRTDYSDDAKWERLLELAGKDTLRVVEGRQYENMTVEDLQPIATETFVIADKQSMEDETFLLAHNDPVWETDEETGEEDMVDTVLKSGRYPASDIWAPAASLPLSNCDWDDIMPYRHSHIR
ncbi:unnamed protein product [Umbelopsis ramanniana]